MIDVSIVIPAHRGGRLSHHTMLSIARARDFAHRRGLSTELVISLDNSDRETVEYFSRCREERVTIQEVHVGDLGLNRNLGRARAQGRYVTFIDEDNLFCENWLVRAHEHLERHRERQLVVHPEYHVFFEGKDLLWRQLSDSDPAFDRESLIEHNFWDAASMASRELYERHPYTPTTGETGSPFGFEDWHFNCETLAAGVAHHVVPQTVHFMRSRRAGSLLAHSFSQNRVLRPSRLFDVPVPTAPGEEKASLPEAAAPPGWVRRTHRAASGVLSRGARASTSASRSLARRLASVQPALTQFGIDLLTAFIRLFAAIRCAARSAWLPARDAPAQPPRGIPAWLIAEWRTVHAIEPLLFPERRLLATIPFHQIPRSRIAPPYRELRPLFPDGTSHVFLVPWIERGGADIAALNYVAALAELGYARRTAVVTTADRPSPWAEKLPAGVSLVEFGRRCPHLGDDERTALLCRLLLQVRPHAVHNVNSEEGYRVFVRHGKALRSQSRLYATLFCADQTEEGREVGYALSYLPRCFDALTAASFDTSAFPGRLERLFAFEGSKLFHHRQPARPARQRTYENRVPGKGRLDVLWAGRLDRQKRPDLLLRIAEECRRLPIRFHVHGIPFLDDDTWIRRLRSQPNVTYYGVFEGLASLPVEECDVFLYTSQWDGLPTILFDAIALGLPVVASDVGGVGELIRDGETGSLVSPFDDVAGYAQRLAAILQDQSQLPRMTREARDVLETRHTWQGFAEAVRAFPEYLPGDTRSPAAGPPRRSLTACPESS